MKTYAFFVTLCFLCCVACHDQKTATAPEPVTNPITLDDVQAAPITSLVGQEILLHENVTWILSPVGTSGIADLTSSQTDLYALYAEPLALHFDNDDQYIANPRFQEEGNGDIEIVSPDISTRFNAEQQEEYVYKGKTLDPNRMYYLQGSFQYSDPGCLAWLDDPEFIAQSNNVAYWGATFVFRLTSLSEKSPQ